MFSKAKSKDAGAEVRQNADAKASSETVREPATKRSASGKGGSRPRAASRPAGVPSIISADMIIRGEIESAGEVQFDGELEGDIRAKGLVIGEGAKVVGEVVADKVRVSGNVEGAIRAVEVELAATALVHGDITHTSLSIESGARFDGAARHSESPLDAEDEPAGRTPATPTVRPAPPPTQTDAKANEVVVEPVVETPRELMPTRSNPTADRRFVNRPATGTGAGLR